MYLAIETSGRGLGVALISDKGELASYEVLGIDHPHAVELPDAIKRVLFSARSSLKQLAGLVVDVGPGSFTGLRIGLAFVKAVAFTTKKSVVGISSLEVLAAGLPYVSSLICPLLDAKQKNVYATLYRWESSKLIAQMDDFLGPVDELLCRIHESAIFLGDGCDLYRDKIMAHNARHQISAREFWLPRTATLARLGMERLLQGYSDDPSSLVPRYLYPRDCQVRGPTRPTSRLPSPAQVL